MKSCAESLSPDFHIKLLGSGHNWSFSVLTHDGLHLLEQLNHPNVILTTGSAYSSLSQVPIGYQLLSLRENKGFRNIKEGGDL